MTAGCKDTTSCPARGSTAGTTPTRRSGCKKNYPGEILTQDTTPSIRLLSLVSWQYRLSVKQYQEIHEAKTQRPWRSEMQLLAHAFVDDTPEINLDNKPLSPGWFYRCQAVFRNALAMCGAAHLANLKLYDARVADYALASAPSGLRTVTTQEFLAADRKLWQTISELLIQKWALDDALYELTAIRNDVPSLLQLRAAAPRAPPDPRGTKRTRQDDSGPRTKGKGKGDGKGNCKKGGPSSPRGGTSSPAANWVDTFQGKQICRRFQTGACTSPKCKYLHVCAIKGCHQAHPAKEHPSNRT